MTSLFVSAAIYTHEFAQKERKKRVCTKSYDLLIATAQPQNSLLSTLKLRLTDPETPHADDDQGVEGDEQQIDAEQQEVQHVSHVAPLLLQLALLLQGHQVGAKLHQVLTDLLELRWSGWTCWHCTGKTDHGHLSWL